MFPLKSPYINCFFFVSFSFFFYCRLFLMMKALNFARHQLSVSTKYEMHCIVLQNKSGKIVLDKN